MAVALVLAFCLQEESMETLLRRFGEDDPARRDDASKTIVDRWRGWKDADLDRLRKAAEDPDGELAGRAKETLATIALRRHLGEALLRELPTLEQSIREGSPESRAHELLQAALLWKSGKLEESALRVLAAIAVERGWSFDTEMRQSLCILPEGGFPVPAYAPLIAPLLKSPDPEERVAAANTLGTLGAGAYAADVAALLKNVDKGPRVAAIRALGSMDARAFSDAIAEQLDLTEAYEIKLAAIEALGRLRAPESTLALIVRFLDDGAPDVVLRAVEALGHAGNRNLSGQVAKLLKNSNPTARTSAADVLGRMGAVEHAAAVAELLQEARPDGRANAPRQALESLGRMGAADFAGAIARGLKDPDDWVRATAARALGRVGATGRAAELYPLLNDPSIDARWNAVQALGDLLTPETAGDMVRLLTSDSHFLRGLAATVLGRIGDRAHADQIAELLEEGQPFVRAEAAKALAALGSAKHRKAIALLLEDEFEEVRTDSALALGRLAMVPPDRAEAELLQKQLEEASRSLTPTARNAAGVALTWYGGNALDVLRALREAGEEYPEVLFEGLGWLKERETYVKLSRPIPLDRPIDSMARLVDVLGTVGLRLEGTDGLLFQGRIPPGPPTTARRLLQNLWETKYIVIQEERIRLLPRDEAYAVWEARLLGKAK